MLEKERSILFTEQSLTGFSETESYIYGLLLADGHMSESTRNRGKICIELSDRDEDIIDKLCVALGTTKRCRLRDTNFKDNYVSVQTTIYDWSTRKVFKSAGFPVGNKSMIASPPSVPYVKRDFWRGFIDGNGSIGASRLGVVFVSLVIKSEAIKTAYCDFINDITGVTVNVNRNKRDNVYNIMITRAAARELAAFLYEGKVLSIDRKRNKALSIIGIMPKLNTEK